MDTEKRHEAGYNERPFALVQSESNCQANEERHAHAKFECF